MYSVEIGQRANSKWRWVVKTKSVSTHPLYKDMGDSWRTAREEVWSDERTFKRAMRRASEVVAEHVARDVEYQLRKSFESTSPTAKAKV